MRPSIPRASARRLPTITYGSRILRGGRVTKWKGEAASYAPNVAQLVASAMRASSLLALAAGCGFLALLGAAPASAQTLHWDGGTVNGGNPAANADGGTGTWDTTITNWDTAATGGAAAAWVNGANDAIFGGSSGTVTLGVPITAHNLTFGTTGYSITSNTLTLDGAAPTITTNPSVSATISSIIAGTSGLTKAGTGTLTLSGANTFTGGINVTAGTLSVNGNTSLGDAANGITMAAGTTLTANTVSNLASTRVVTLSGGAVTLSGSRVGSARFTGAGGVTASGAINLSNNANDYTGQTQFGGAAGTYSFSSIADVGGGPSALGAPTTAGAGAIVVNHTSSLPILNYTGAGHSSNRDWSVGGLSGTGFRLRNSGSGALTLTGAITVSQLGVGNVFFEANGGDLALLGVISRAFAGSMNFSSTSGRTITLGDANTYTGVTTISNATVRAGVIANKGVASSLGTGSGTVAGISILSNGTLSYAGSGASVDRPWSFNSGTFSNDGSGALALSGAVTLTGAGTLAGSYSGAANSISGVISGAGALTVNTAGAWALGGTNTYTGATTINAGTLQAGAAAGGQAFGLNSAVTLANVAGATLDLNGFNQTIGSLAGGGATGGNVLLGAGVLATGGNNTSTTYSGVISGAGSLTKTGTGAMTLTSAANSVGATTVNAGTLDVDGVLTTGTVTMGDGMLNVDGAVQASGATQTVLANTVGTASTVTIGSGGTLLAAGDLGDGADVLDVAGTLDTGAGALDLGDGDDRLTIHDGTDIIGTVVAGAGADTLNTDIATSADVGAVQGFETLSKTGVGTLNFNGPANSVFDTVLVQGGTLHVSAGAVVDPQTTVVSSGATMTVDGTYTGTAGADTFTVSGTVNGAGNIDLLGDDDVLTLNDGADLSGLANPLDGGAHGAGDTVVLNNAGALTFNGSNIVNFESLQKTSTGSATLTGVSAFSGGATLSAGALDVDGALETPTIGIGDNATLNVDGIVQAAGATQSTVTGSAGVNTVTVSAGGALLATGDLGDGADILDVAGTLDAGGGAFLLGGGDDAFTVHDGTIVLGAVDGGAGLDTRLYNINLTADLGALLNFEGLTKTGTGVLNVTGPGASSLTQVEVLGGVLNVNAVGAITDAENTLVAAGATLTIDGAYSGTAGADTFTLAGTLTGAGAGVALGDGDDVLTLQDGAVLGLLVDGGGHINGDTLVLDNALAFTFDGANTANFEALVKQNAGTATLSGVQAFVSGTTISAGVLDVDGALETPTIGIGDNATLNVDGIVQAAGAAQTAVTGSAGSNTVAIGAGGTLLATGDLGDGADILDVAGTLDAGAGVFLLGDGDDTFAVHDGTIVLGTVDGGAGLDTRLYNINLTADLGALVNFEGLTKTGAGTLNINGPGVSTFSAINVIAGTLQVASGASVDAAPGASLNANVASGATLNVDGAFGCGDSNDTLTIAGALSGSGTVNQCGGDDVLTLTESADLSGFGGDIDGGAHSAGDTLRLDVAGAMTFDAGAPVTNYEFLVKQNVGAVALTGAHAFAGGATIEEGVLSLEGTLQTPLVNILLAGTLGGSGQIMGDVSNAGIIAPGASGAIGTLTVDGDVNFLAGSTLAVDIDPTGASDHLSATGVVTIAGGVVDVTNAPGTYTPDTQWTLITAAGGRIGEFDALIGDLPFVDLTLIYDPTHVYLAAERNEAAFCDVALTRNQCASAAGAESTGAGAPIYDAIAGLPDETSARQAFDLLSGEIHASARGALMEDSRFIREAATSRLRAALGGVGAAATPVRAYGPQGPEAAPPDTRLGAVWTHAFGAFADIDGDANAAGLDRTIGGVFIGADAAVSDAWRVGLVAGYDQRSIDADARASSASVDTYHAGIYAGARFNAFSLRLGAALAGHDVNTRRSIVFPGFAETATSSYGASTAQAFAELGRRFDVGEVALEPFVAIAYVHQDVADVQETGGDAALSANGAEEDLIYTTLGLRFERGVALSAERDITLRGAVAWRHALEEITPAAQLAFAGGVPFAVEGPGLARDTLAIEAGVDVALGAQARFSIAYDGRVGGGVEDHGVTASLAVRF